VNHTGVFQAVCECLPSSFCFDFLIHISFLTLL
jgi:hypothetical protein